MLGANNHGKDSNLNAQFFTFGFHFNDCIYLEFLGRFCKNAMVDLGTGQNFFLVYCKSSRNKRVDNC